MNSQAVNSSSPNDSRCHHRYPNGSRCRIAAPSADARFCRRHAGLPQNQREAVELAATLTADLSEFESAADVNEFLSRLLLAFAQDRISPRRAAVLAYITSQILRTLTAIEHETREAKAGAKREPPVKFIWDIPRPAHEQPTTT